MINQSMVAKDWAMLLLLSFLWGGSFLFISIAVSELPPFTLVTMRVGLAAVTLWAGIADLWLPCPQIPRGLAGIYDNGLAWQCAALLSDSLGADPYWCRAGINY